LGPTLALVGGAAVGIGEDFGGGEGFLEGVGGFAFFHDEVAAEVDDFFEGVDEDGAFLDAGAAGGAGPEGFGRDDVGGETPGIFPWGIIITGRIMVGGVNLAVLWWWVSLRSTHPTLVSQAQDDLFGGEDFAGGGGGALAGAAAAFGAGVEVEEVFL